MRELVVAVHPDDETLGCGGTILRSVAEGNAVSWAIVTQAHEPQWSADTIERKRGEREAVADAYGMASVHRLGFPTTKLDVLPRGELIDALRTVVEEVRPEVVYVTEIMALYASEAQPDPLPRGPGALRAQARGRGAAIGVEYAEAFCLAREIRPL